jgi:hypothetical protein
MPPSPLWKRAALASLRFLCGGRFPVGRMDLSMTVLIYVDVSKEVGDPEHLKIFANVDAAEAWFAVNETEGVAFEYEVIKPPV